MADRLVAYPLTITDARLICAELHRHHKPPVSGLFAVGCAPQGGKVVGVAIVGRPVSRHFDDGWTAEVTRVATDGTKNACSFLYGAAWRACKALGYTKLVTYTLLTEPGTSLRAAGWTAVHQTKAERWSRPSRERFNEPPEQTKIRWEVSATSTTPRPEL